jgi:hypothetical protein
VGGARDGLAPIIAPLPESLQHRCLAAPGLLAQVIVSKYSLRVHSVNSIWAIGTGRQCHRFIIALARQKTRFIVIAGVLADIEQRV